MLERTALIGCLCLLAPAVGCEAEKQKPKKEAWQKPEQVYTDKTPQEWLELIQHHNVQARNRAIDALIRYCHDGRDTVPQLIEILQGAKSGQVRLSVARALGEMGSQAKAAGAALCKALKDTAWEQRDAAAQALGGIGVGDDRTISTLIGALQDDPDERVRGEAAGALGRLRAAEAKAVDALAAALEDKDHNVRARAADALGRIGPPARSAADALKKAAGAERFNVRSAAEEALKNVHQ